MMTVFATIYLLCICAVAYTLYKHYDEFMKGTTYKIRIIRNVIAMLLAPVLMVIGIIVICTEELKK